MLQRMDVSRCCCGGPVSVGAEAGSATTADYSNWIKFGAPVTFAGLPDGGRGYMYRIYDAFGIDETCLGWAVSFSGGGMPSASATVSTAYLEFPGAGSSSEASPIAEPSQSIKVWVADNNLAFTPATHLTGFNWSVSSTWGSTATRQTASIVSELNAILSNGTYDPADGVTIGFFVQSQTPNAFGSGYRWFQDTPSVPITDDAFLVWQ